MQDNASIAHWLQEIGLAEYSQLFIDQAISVDLLSTLSDDDLKELGITVMGHRKRLLQAAAAAMSRPELTQERAAHSQEQRPVGAFPAPAQVPSSEARHLSERPGYWAVLVSPWRVGRMRLVGLILAALLLLGAGLAVSLWFFDSEAVENDAEVELLCEGGQVRSGALCCWPGQSEGEGGTCVGAPLCPDGTLVEDLGCVPGCEAGKALQDGHCCWLGQHWDAAQGACAGDATPGVLLLSSNVDGGNVNVGGEERARTVSASAVEVALGLGPQRLTLSRRGYHSQEVELSLLPGERRELRLELEVAVPAGYVLIPAGTFWMGSPSGERGRFPNERRHEVTLTRSFFLKATEVTQGEYKSLMGNNPSYFRSCGESCPVENVSWRQAVDYCRALSRSEGLEDCYHDGRALRSLDCDGYRLPTEAEWEYAARAGSEEARYGRLGEVAWYWDNAGRRTRAVGQKLPNAWGLYDMLGNVWEWCGDWYGSYPSGAVTDPTGPSSGRNRVVRGGGWGDDARYVRAANRSGFTPSYRYRYVGFRCARSLIP